MIYIIGGIILFSLGFTLSWLLKLPIQHTIWDIQDAIEEKKAILEWNKFESDKAYMADQLKLKLETEALLNQVDDDVRKSLDEIGGNVDISV